MRCLVNGDLTTDKVNTSLITIYKNLEEVENTLKSINKTLEDYDKRLKALEESNQGE